MRTPFLAAFDFDWTIVDEDSDRWTFQVNNPKVAEKVCQVRCFSRVAPIVCIKLEIDGRISQDNGLDRRHGMWKV
jgi:hypothetical protein